MNQPTNMFKTILAIGLASLCLQLVLADSFEEQCLAKHNEYRALHSAPQLELDPEIQAYAQEWADHLASTGTFNHRPNPIYGENLFAGGGTTVDGYAPVIGWYSEIQYYDWSNPGFSMEAGHFTQVIWADSQKLGCAKATNGEFVYVVANYGPPGNYIGMFEQNVLPL